MYLFFVYFFKSAKESLLIGYFRARVFVLPDNVGPRQGDRMGLRKKFAQCVAERIFVKNNAELLLLNNVFEKKLNLGEQFSRNLPTINNRQIGKYSA
jgi:hypothetical protein